MKKRTVIYISDRTGITAETMGHSLITQFEQIEFTQITLPFIDSEEKAYHVVNQINDYFLHDGVSPIVFGTIINGKIRQIIRQSHGFYLDFVHTFIGPLETELTCVSNHTVGRSHSMSNSKHYNTRMEAVNFALQYDDGISTRGYEQAEIILIGASRSGKTPTCLYLAMQFGIMAANFPIVPEDLTAYPTLPKEIQPYLTKLFGLTIEAERLQAIRYARKPDSTYADLTQCQREVEAIENLFQRYQIPYLSSTNYSVEELATLIIAQTKISRKLR
jgi:regulator of PEP synthase PpsR (kinase-PPPase family)